MSERFKTMEQCVFSNLSTVLLNRQTSLHRKQTVLGNLCGLLWTCAKSTSLRRNAKEKEKTRKDLEDKIVNVVDEQKNTDFYLSVNSAQWLL